MRVSASVHHHQSSLYHERRPYDFSGTWRGAHCPSSLLYEADFQFRIDPFRPPYFADRGLFVRDDRVAGPSPHTPAAPHGEERRKPSSTREKDDDEVNARATRGYASLRTSPSPLKRAIGGAPATVPAHEEATTFPGPSHDHWLADGGLGAAPVSGDLGLPRLPGVHRYKRSYNEELLRLWTVERALEGHHGCINTIHIDSSGEYLLTGSDDCALCVYDTSFWQLKTRLATRHHANIFSAVFMQPSQGGTSRVMSCALDGLVLLTDLETGAMVKKCESSSMASSLAVSRHWPESAYVAYGHGYLARVDCRMDNTGLFDAMNFPMMTRPCITYSTAVNALAVHERYPYLLAVGTDCAHVLLHDVRMGLMKPFAALTDGTMAGSTTPAEGVGGLSFSERGDYLAVNYRGADVVLLPWAEALREAAAGYTASGYEISPGTDPALWQLGRRGGYVSAQLQTSSAHRVPLVSCVDATHFTGRDNNVTMFKEVAFMEDDTVLCTGGDDGNVYFWRTADARLVHRTEGDGDIVNGVLYHPKVRKLVCCGIDSTCKVMGPRVVDDPAPGADENEVRAGERPERLLQRQRDSSVRRAVVAASDGPSPSSSSPAPRPRQASDRGAHLAEVIQEALHFFNVADAGRVTSSSSETSDNDAVLLEEAEESEENEEEDGLEMFDQDRDGYVLLSSSIESSNESNSIDASDDHDDFFPLQGRGQGEEEKEEERGTVPRPLPALRERYPSRVVLLDTAAARGHAATPAAAAAAAAARWRQSQLPATYPSVPESAEAPAAQRRMPPVKHVPDRARMMMTAVTKRFLHVCDLVLSLTPHHYRMSEVGDIVVRAETFESQVVRHIRAMNILFPEESSNSSVEDVEGNEDEEEWETDRDDDSDGDATGAMSGGTARRFRTSVVAGGTALETEVLPRRSRQVVRYEDESDEGGGGRGDDADDDDGDEENTSLDGEDGNDLVTYLAGTMNATYGTSSASSSSATSLSESSGPVLASDAASEEDDGGGTTPHRDADATGEERDVLWFLGMPGGEQEESSSSSSSGDSGNHTDSSGNVRGPITPPSAATGNSARRQGSPQRREENAENPVEPAEHAADTPIEPRAEAATSAGVGADTREDIGSALQRIVAAMGGLEDFASALRVMAAGDAAEGLGGGLSAQAQRSEGLDSSEGDAAVSASASTVFDDEWDDPWTTETGGTDHRNPDSNDTLEEPPHAYYRMLTRALHRLHCLLRVLLRRWHWWDAATDTFVPVMDVQNDGLTPTYREPYPAHFTHLRSLAPALAWPLGSGRNQPLSGECENEEGWQTPPQRTRPASGPAAAAIRAYERQFMRYRRRTRQVLSLLFLLTWKGESVFAEVNQLGTHSEHMRTVLRLLACYSAAAGATGSAYTYLQYTDDFFECAPMESRAAVALPSTAAAEECSRLPAAMVRHVPDTRSLSSSVFPIAQPCPRPLTAVQDKYDLLESLIVAASTSPALLKSPHSSPEEFRSRFRGWQDVMVVATDEELHEATVDVDILGTSAFPSPEAGCCGTFAQLLRCVLSSYQTANEGVIRPLLVKEGLHPETFAVVVQERRLCIRHYAACAGLLKRCKDRVEAMLA